MKDKNKNRKGYKKTKVGWIPEKWNCSRLENAASVRTGPFGAQLHERDYVDNGTPIVTVEHLSELGIVHRNLPLVSDEDKRRLSRYILNMGDIVFSRVGSVDRNSLVSTREEGWLFSGRLLRVRPIRKYLFPSYISYVFHQQTFKNHMRNIAVGGTMACLNTALLSRVFIPLPPLPEQKAIASVLESWDKAIQKYEEMIEKKKNIKKGLMQKLLSGEQRLPGFDGEWEETTLDNICDITMGQSPLSSSYNDEMLGLPLLQGNADICNGYSKPRFWTTQPSKKCFPNDILMTVRAPVGEIATSMHEACIGRGMCSIRATESLHDFVFHQLKGLELSWRTISQGSTFSAVSSKDIKKLIVTTPPIPEQKAIASVLSSADSEIKTLDKKLTLLRDQKKYLLNNLVTGTIRLPEFCMDVG